MEVAGAASADRAAVDHHDVARTRPASCSWVWPVRNTSGAAGGSARSSSRATAGKRGGVDHHDVDPAHERSQPAARTRACCGSRDVGLAPSRGSRRRGAARTDRCSRRPAGRRRARSWRRAARRAAAARAAVSTIAPRRASGGRACRSRGCPTRTRTAGPARTDLPGEGGLERHAAGREVAGEEQRAAPRGALERRQREQVVVQVRRERRGAGGARRSGRSRGIEIRRARSSSWSSRSWLSAVAERVASWAARSATGIADPLA